MKLPKNMGDLDRTFRFIIATIAIILYFSGTVTGFWGMVILLFAAATSFTGITGYCPLYPIFGWNTCKIKDKKQ